MNRTKALQILSKHYLKQDYKLNDNVHLFYYDWCKVLFVHNQKRDRERQIAYEIFITQDDKHCCRFAITNHFVNRFNSRWFVKDSFSFVLIWKVICEFLDYKNEYDGERYVIQQGKNCHTYVMYSTEYSYICRTYWRKKKN